MTERVKPPVTKNQRIELLCEDLSSQGAGVGRFEGYTLFVPGLLPGERGTVQVLSRHRRAGHPFAKPFPSAAGASCSTFPTKDSSGGSSATCMSFCAGWEAFP